MQRKTLVLVGLAAVVAIALVFWYLRRGGGAATDSAGQTKDAGAGTAVLTAPGPGTDPDDAEPMPEAPPPVSFENDPEGPLRLEGQVLDELDHGVGGVTVTLSSVPRRTATSEADGSFVFEKLVPRTYALTARSGDQIGGPVMHKLTASSDPVAIRLRKGALLRVSAVDEADAPIRGVTIELRDNEKQEKTTDEAGLAVFDGVSTGFVIVAARSDKHALTLTPVQIADTPGIEVATRIVLREGAAVRGKVVDGDGKPVAGASVAAVDTSNLLPLGSLGQSGVETDKKGEFVFGRIAAGSYRFRASKDEFMQADSEPVTTDGITETTGVVIAMSRGGRVSGRVLDQQKRPVPWATVRIGASADSFGANNTLRQITADGDGAFVVRSLPRTKLAAVASSPLASSATTEVDLTALEVVEGVELVLTIEGVISGIVVDGKGQPLAEAQVSAFPDFWAGAKMDDFALRGVAAESTDGGGRFSFHGLPDGTYRLRAARSEMSATQWTQSGQQAAVGDTNVKLILPANGKIKGVVSYAEGAHPPLFTVTTAYPPGTPFSTDDGQFALDEVPPGTYDVTIRGPGFADYVARKVVVSSDAETDLGTLEVKRGRTISGKVRDGSGRVVEGALVVAARQLIADGSTLAPSFGAGQEEASGVRRATSNADGVYQLTGVGPGELLLAADHPQRGRSNAATLPAAGGSQVVDLVLVPVGRVTGMVTAGGNPQAKATVIATPPSNGNNIVAVNTGTDGKFVIERLAAGTQRLTAILQSSGIGGDSAGVDVIVVPGGEVKADIEITVGELELTIIIAGKAGAKIDASQVFLFRGAVAAQSGKDIQDAFLSASGAGGANMTFARGDNPAVFKSASPGQSTICVIPITGDLNDPAFAQRLQANANNLKVYCSRHELGSTPLKQEIKVQVPAMDPLPEPASP